MSDVDISRERIERLKSMGAADYIHIAMLDLIEELKAANHGLVRLNEATEARAKTAEAKLAEYKHVASAIDTQWAESQDEIADLKAKLAKTVEALQFYGTLIGEKHECPWHMNSEDFGAKARTTLAELTGGKDE